MRELLLVPGADADADETDHALDIIVHHQGVVERYEDQPAAADAADIVAPAITAEQADLSRGFLANLRCGTAGARCCCCNSTPCTLLYGAVAGLRPADGDMTETKAGKRYEESPRGRRHYVYHELLHPRGRRAKLFSCELLAVRLINPGWPLKGYLPPESRVQAVANDAGGDDDAGDALADGL
jgi:hypothetical protein